MSDFAPVAARLAARAETNREALFELLRIPSVSAQPDRRADCRRAAEWCRDFLTGHGCTADLIETGTADDPGHPIVLAKSEPVPGAKTLLVYGHYDVQPPDPLDLWTTPPFEPTVRDGKVFARGATDDKGQMLTHPLAVAAWHAVAGGPPVNVTLVIEGEEEVGSDHLDAFLTEAEGGVGLRRGGDFGHEPVRPGRPGDLLRPAGDRGVRDHRDRPEGGPAQRAVRRGRGEPGERAVRADRLAARRRRGGSPSPGSTTASASCRNRSGRTSPPCRFRRPTFWRRPGPRGRTARRGSARWNAAGPGRPAT